MGNAQCHVTNDTEEEMVILTYNYMDSFQWASYAMYVLQKSETATVYAAPDPRGLKLCLQKKGQKSGIYVAANNEHVTVSDINTATGSSITLTTIKSGLSGASDTLVNSITAAGALVGSVIKD